MSVSLLEVNCGLFAGQQKRQTSYGYTGEQFHAGTGLLYLRARYYSPALHAFTGRDQWQGNTRRPITLNSYAYANSNPIRFIDPSGLCGTLPDGTPLCPSGGTVGIDTGTGNNVFGSQSLHGVGIPGWWDILVYTQTGYSAVYHENSYYGACSAQYGPLTGGLMMEVTEKLKWEAPTLGQAISNWWNGSKPKVEQETSGEGSIGLGINNIADLTLYGGANADGHGKMGIGGSMGNGGASIELSGGDASTAIQFELSMNTGFQLPIGCQGLQSSSSLGIESSLHSSKWVAVPSIISRTGVDPNALAFNRFPDIVRPPGTESDPSKWYQYERVAFSFFAGMESVNYVLGMENLAGRSRVPMGTPVYMPFTDDKDGMSLTNSCGQFQFQP